MRRDLVSEGIIKKHSKPTKDRQSNIEKNGEGKKNLSKNAEYFKTFCNKGMKGTNRNTINATNTATDGNPFSSFQKENNSSQKKAPVNSKYAGINVANPFPS
mmetsp:Transcript_43298/g.41689  ORF Transcript_43298/g.41689 Transcript_43298/m.41689 type:complete len:102 (+) Transcript_43298:1854-2159(+)